MIGETDMRHENLYPLGHSQGQFHEEASTHRTQGRKTGDVVRVPYHHRDEIWAVIADAMILSFASIRWA